MTRKHFAELAALVARYGAAGPTVCVDQLARDLATICADSNPRFSRTRFMDACRLPTIPTKMTRDQA